MEGGPRGVGFGGVPGALGGCGGGGGGCHGREGIAAEGGGGRRAAGGASGVCGVGGDGGAKLVALVGALLLRALGLELAGGRGGGAGGGGGDGNSHRGTSQYSHATLAFTVKHLARSGSRVPTTNSKQSSLRRRLTAQRNKPWNVRRNALVKRELCIRRDMDEEAGA